MSAALPERNAAVVADREDGMAVAAIARKYGVTDGRVRQILDRHEGKMRTRRFVQRTANRNEAIRLGVLRHLPAFQRNAFVLDVLANR